MKGPWKEHVHVYLEQCAHTPFHIDVHPISYPALLMRISVEGNTFSEGQYIY